MRKPARIALALGAAASLAFAAGESDFHIPFEKYKLQNGLRVVLSRDTAVPVIAVYLIYDVGARAEEKGRTGFAHLFEHMMFEGSANLKKGDHFHYVQANGGELNGSTHPDYTDYFETMPSNKLGLALWLESDRMRSLAITPENLKDQQEAVKQERRLRFDNEAYNTAIIDKWPALVFGNFQSSHSLIGSFEDLEAASVDDVAKFFKTYYAPNNAVLVIAGDFDSSDAKKLVEQYFGNIPSQPQPVRPDMTEPARTQGKTETVADQHARVPGVVIGWPAPKRHTDEWYALGMLDAVLTSGESSRMQLDLVKGKQTVIQFDVGLGWPFAGFNDFKDPGEYAAFLLYKPNYKPQQIVDEVQEEIDRIAKDGVDDKELSRVKAVMRFQKVSGLQSSLARARLVGQYELLDGKPEMMDQDFTNLFKVTSPEIQAVAKKYLMASRRDVLMIQPAPPTPAPKPAPAKEENK
ncbi:MAG TPA: pitrilysin family protein [Bryobacteraceae bacterium]|nr:pitrilysin family protein [Bryobacteraceae bacterium]